MIRSYCNQFNLCLSHIHGCKKPPLPILFGQILSFLFEFSIVFFNCFKEIVQITFKTLIRKKFINNNIFSFNGITGFACQDHNFSDYICSAEINAGIRFRKSYFPGFSDSAA